MADQKYLDYIIEQLKNILAIDSPTGYTKEAAAYVAKQYELLGYQPKITTKGSVLVDLGGEDTTDPDRLCIAVVGVQGNDSPTGGDFP